MALSNYLAYLRRVGHGEGPMTPCTNSVGTNEGPGTPHLHSAFQTSTLTNKAKITMLRYFAICFP